MIIETRTNPKKKKASTQLERTDGWNGNVEG